jgi:hypothetical protein
MLHETEQQFKILANSAMRGRGQDRGSNNRGGCFGQAGGHDGH